MTLAVMDHTLRGVLILLGIICFLIAFVLYLAAHRPRAADHPRRVNETVVAAALGMLGLALVFIPAMVDAFDAA